MRIGDNVYESDGSLEGKRSAAVSSDDYSHRRSAFRWRRSTRMCEQRRSPSQSRTYIAEQDELFASAGYVTIERWFTPQTEIEIFLVGIHLKFELIVEFDVLERDTNMGENNVEYRNEPLPLAESEFDELETFVSNQYSS